jgi:nitrate/TMAO reductase-like tetraheme cytochrome c subunit
MCASSGWRGRVRPGPRLCQNRQHVRERRRIAGAALAWVVGALAMLASVPVGWVVSDHFEQDNDFCNACHLTPEQPLHEEIRVAFDAKMPVTLASVHGSAAVSHRDDPAFRCIDCHGGHDLPSRAKVKVLAGIDAFWWLVGRFEEPDQMAWPLEDGDCVKCHTGFEQAEAEPWASPRFHDLAVHNVDLGVDCVTCHAVHKAGGNPEGYFLIPDRVRSQCARCHSQYAGS